MVLAEDAAQVAPAEEDAAGAIVALETGFFAKVRGDSVDEDIGSDQTVAGGFEAVDAAETGAEVAVGEVRVGEGPLAGCIGGGEKLVAGGVGV